MERCPKVCILVAYHPFLDARIFKKEALSLVRNSYDVTMVVPRKNGYLFDIDGTRLSDRFLEESFVHERVKFVTYDGDTARVSVPEMLNNLSSGNFQSFLDPLTQTAIRQEADIYHAQEFLSLYSGVGVKRAMKAKKKAVKLIYDSHEVVPDPYGPKTQRLKDLQEMLGKMLSETDYVIAISDAMRAWYLSLNAKLPINIIYNSPPLAPKYIPKQFHPKKLTVGYEGNITANKGNFDKIIGITENCSRKVDFTFKIIGGIRQNGTNPIPPGLQNNIVLAGWVDYHSIPKNMKDVEIGWIDYEMSNSLNHAVALPNKFFSYLNNGVPVVVNKCPEMARFIRTYNCGFVIDKENATVEDYTKALLHLHNKKQKLLTEMSMNARRVMEEKYSWEHMEKRLLKIYRYLAPS